MPFTVCGNCHKTICHPIGGFFCDCQKPDPLKTVKEIQATQFADWVLNGRSGMPYSAIISVFLGVETLQTPDEIVWLYKMLKRPPKKVLEIGGWRGGTARLWRQLWDADTITVELRPMKGLEQECKLIAADSMLDSTVNKILDASCGELFDMVFIDGDHSDKGVARDFELYSPLCAPGGVVAFHDILWNKESVGVFFDSLPGRKSRIDIYQGIGLLWH